MMTFYKNYFSAASIISKILSSTPKNGTFKRVLSSQVLPVNERWTRFTKVVHPGNVQMLDMVQGGEIMKFLESAADNAATKYCLRNGVKCSANKPPHPALVGVERVEMMGTAKVGDMMEFIGQVTHVTSRSLRISVDVFCYTWANLSNKYLMAKAWLWYVPITMSGQIGCFNIESILKLNQNVKEDEFVKESINNYMSMLAKCKDVKKSSSLSLVAKELIVKPKEDLQSTMYSVSPSVCSVLNRCQAGEILRWVDEFGAISAYKSSKRQCVTGSFDNCIITKPVPSGSCITFVARPVFSSKRTMDVQIIGCMDNQDGLETIFFNGFATYVMARVKENENFTIPPLQLKTEEEIQTFNHRQMLHDTKKIYLKKLKNFIVSNT